MMDRPGAPEQVLSPGGGSGPRRSPSQGLAEIRPGARSRSDFSLAVVKAGYKLPPSHQPRASIAQPAIQA